MDANGGKDFYHGLLGAHGLEAGIGGRQMSEIRSQRSDCFYHPLR